MHAQTIAPLLRHLLKFRRRFQSVDAPDTFRVEGQIQTRTNAHFEHLTTSLRNPGSAQASRVLVSHRKIDDMWQNVFRIEGHRYRANGFIRPCNSNKGIAGR